LHRLIFPDHQKRFAVDRRGYYTTTTMTIMMTRNMNMNGFSSTCAATRSIAFAFLLLSLQQQQCLVLASHCDDATNPFGLTKIIIRGDLLPAAGSSAMVMSLLGLSPPTHW
jgi:hypothetical protein